MPKFSDPKSKTLRIYVEAKNDEQADTIRAFKKILATDQVEVADVLLPVIERYVKERAPSNPQTLLDPVNPRGMTLSRRQKRPEELPGNAVKVPCECGGRDEWCRMCFGKGYWFNVP